LQRIDTASALGENGDGKRRPGEPASAGGICTMTLRSAATTLLTLAIGLPIVQSVLFWTRGLLHSMGDDAGAAIVGHVGTAFQVVWSISLVGLLVVLAVIVLYERPPDKET
jgi:hypothetical protein